MKYKICLHAVDVKSKGQLIDLIKKLWPSAVGQSKLKEKYFADDSFIKYKSTIFSDMGKKGFKATCVNGMMVVNDRMYPLNEIILEFTKGDFVYAERLLKKLLSGKLKFVLDEPEMKLRFRQRQGSFKLWHLPNYDENSLSTVCVAHLPLQIYEISKQWGMFLNKPADKVLVRQLRVRLRRLRSTLTLFKPLFAAEKTEKWKLLLKKWADSLGDTREYDVALMTCMKIKSSQKKQETTELEKLFSECRLQASAKVMQIKNINDITQLLTAMLLDLYNAKLNDVYRQMKIKVFLKRRLTEWCDKLQQITFDDEVLQDMQQLHRVRIKIKRLRYALQAVAEINVTSNLLRSLKNMQDNLGFLHDNYINSRLLENILDNKNANNSLRCEAAMFCGWDSAKREVLLESLPHLWQSFCSTLQSWQEEHL